MNLVVDDSQQPAGVSPYPNFFQNTRACGIGTTALQFDLSQQMIDDGRRASIYEILSGQIDLKAPYTIIDAADTGTISSTPILAGDVDLNKDTIIGPGDTSPPTFFTYGVLSGKMDVAAPFGTIDAADTLLSPLGLTETATASLVGGCVVPGSTDPADTVFPCNPDTVALKAPAVATVTYRTVMQDVYSCPVPSGDQTIDQNDSLSNAVDIAGHVLDNEAPADPTTGTTVEDSSAGVTLPVGVLSKQVYASQRRDRRHRSLHTRRPDHLQAALHPAPQRLRRPVAERLPAPAGVALGQLERRQYRRRHLDLR